MKQPRSEDTGGLFFPKALQHLFVGLYIQQLFLLGLFLLARNEKGHLSALPEGILMVALLIITVRPQVLSYLRTRLTYVRVGEDAEKPTKRLRHQRQDSSSARRVSSPPTRVARRTARRRRACAGHGIELHISTSPCVSRAQ